MYQVWYNVSLVDDIEEENYDDIDYFLVDLKEEVLHVEMSKKGGIKRLLRR